MKVSVYGSFRQYQQKKQQHSPKFVSLSKSNITYPPGKKERENKILQNGKLSMAFALSYIFKNPKLVNEKYESRCEKLFFFAG